VIFIDTGAFIARYLVRDQHHQDGVSYWRSLQNSGRRCFTTNFVLDETITFLARRATYQFAAERADRFYRSDQITILRPELSDELSAIELFGKYSDQSVSFTDCISFAMMDKFNIESAFTFDHHFRIAGFNIEPA
jgi:predicted nucleic acid-binding protein